MTDVKVRPKPVTAATAGAGAGAVVEGKQKKSKKEKAPVGAARAEEGGDPARPLAGETVVFSGKLSNYWPRAMAESAVRDLGGATKNSITAAVTLLVVSETGGRESSKMKAARDKGIKVWGESEFLDLVRKHFPLYGLVPIPNHSGRYFGDFP